MTERIDITDHPEACIHLWGESALGYAACGPVSFTSQDGRIYLVADRPTEMFSSGERHLWDCLDLIVEGHGLTENDITGCEHLDANNVRVLRVAAGMAETAVAS